MLLPRGILTWSRGIFDNYLLYFVWLKICLLIAGPCDDYVCLNGGHCQEEGGKPKCFCELKYIGKHCEQGSMVKIEQLPTSKCVYYAITFSALWCNHTCHNGGACLVLSGKAKCACRQGWTGNHCEKGEYRVDSLLYAEKWSYHIMTSMLLRIKTHWGVLRTR